MNQAIIKKIQNKIIQLLPIDQQNQPGVLLTDSCSEVSLLVAEWIKALDKTSHILILKGTNVCGTKKTHDILTVMTTKNKVYILDPTIWQFFPRAKSILVFIADDMTTALQKIKETYGGQWLKKTKFIELDKKEKQEYLDIVSDNINENLKQLKITFLRQK